MKAETWRAKRDYSPTELGLAQSILQEIREGVDLHTAQRNHPKPDGGGFIPKHALVAVYYQQIESGERDADEWLLEQI